jgi:DNA-binding transcriptional regulator YhcF (GntR family)
MNIIISGASDKPIYQQIFEQLSAQIIRGDLAPGTALPPIRTVAKELRISVITVKKGVGGTRPPGVHLLNGGAGHVLLRI